MAKIAQKRRKKKGLDLLACSFGGQALKNRVRII